MTVSTPTASSYNPGSAFTASSGYGTRTNPVTGTGTEFHPGQDYAAAAGTPIPAASNGTVIYSGFNASGYGNTVIIQSTGADGATYYTLYAHMNGVSMPAVGAAVTQGQNIGQVGSTGSSTGPHLHFEVLNSSANPTHGSGGSVGFKSSNQSVHDDPNSFSDWGGTTKAPYNYKAGTATPASSGSGMAEDVADPSTGNILAQSETTTSTSDVITTQQANGTNAIGVIGTNVAISASNSIIALASGASANLSGNDNTVTDGGSNILGAAGGNNVINGKASDTIYISGTSSSTGDTLTANSATVDTSQGQYISITGGGNTFNDVGKSVFNASGTGTNTYNLNLDNTVGMGGSVFLGSGASANVTGGGSSVVGAGDNQVGLSFSKESSDTVTISGSGLYSNVTVGANTQANVNTTSADVSLSSGDSVGVYGGGNLITASANNLVVIGNTNGNEDIVAATGLQSGGTTANGQPTGVSLNGSAQVDVQGNNNDVFGNAQSTENLDGGTGDRALLTGGAVHLTTNGTSAQVVGNDNTVGIETVPSQGGTDTASIAGNNNIVAGSHGTVNLQDSNTTTVINGDYLTIHDTPNDIVKVTGTSDSNYGTSSDVIDFYGSTTGDSSSGTPTPVDEGDTDPPGSLDGYGYGYGYDFIKGKLPQSTTNIASIAGFDKSVSAVAVATTSTGDGETINNARSKALQSATDSASGTSTLGDTLEGLRWNTSVVTWSFGSTAFNAQEQSAIESAFSAWSTVSGVKFEQVAGGQSSDIALNFNNLDTASSGVIGFTSYKSADGNFEAGTTIDLEDPTDTALTNGQNGQLTYSGTGVSLYQVALHEIGHALGLNDTSDVNSAMYYGSSSSNQQLDATDIANIQLLYGSPTAPLNVVSTTSTTATSGKDASAPNAASAARGSEHTQAALHTASDGSVNQLIQSIAAFNGSSSAASSPSLLSPDDHPVHLASIYRLSA